MTPPSRVGACAAMALLIATGASCQTLLTSGVWAIADGGNGRMYSVYSGTMSWSAARAYAMTLGPGADLATPVTANENAFIYSLIAGQPSLWSTQINGQGSYGPWIGGTFNGTAWTWVSGEPFCYTHWAFAEPNNACAGGENSLQYALGGNAVTGPIPADTWNDLFDGGCTLGGIYPTGFVVETKVFDTTITQGPTGIGITTGVGIPFGVYLNALLVYPPGGGDPCLNGWLYGVNPTFLDVLNFLSLGPPFYGVLPASGAVAFFFPTTGVGVLQLNYVGILLSPAPTLAVLAAGVPKTLTTF